MKSMLIGGIILIIALMTGTYFMVGNSFALGEDYINDLTMLGGIAIIGITVFVALKYINQIKNDTATGELKKGNWDGIGEYENNVPTGWALMFIGTIIWAMWYMFVGYPTNQFSQIGQYNEETIAYQTKFESKWNNISHEDLVGMGQSVFLVQCAPCHGIDAEGINGKAQNLTKRISKESVLYVINNGANNFKTDFPGGMPAGMASGQDAEDIAEYVANGLNGTAPASFAACASCHGANGEGMDYVAPNIKEYSDKVVASILKDGKKGRIGMMPSFDGRLSETQVKAIANYLRSIGE
ncbi:MAG: cytochrome c oxidase cbb3-type subunit 3 [Arcobacteraceae bacterium]|jgi:cytochrome c oxidase cbb3-type subunit 3